MIQSFNQFLGTNKGNKVVMDHNSSSSCILLLYVNVGMTNPILSGRILLPTYMWAYILFLFKRVDRYVYVNNLKDVESCLSGVSLYFCNTVI